MTISDLRSKGHAEVIGQRHNTGGVLLDRGLIRERSQRPVGRVFIQYQTKRFNVLIISAVNFYKVQAHPSLNHIIDRSR